MKIREITDYLENYFPLSLQMDYDHCGLQVGNPEDDVDRMMVVLTLDREVVDACIEQDIHFILCHHPYLFNPIIDIDMNKPQGKLIADLITHHITVYALHTCMDIGLEQSMNIWLGEALGLSNMHKTIDSLVVEGTIETTTTYELASRIKKQFKLEGVRYCVDKEITTVAIVGGSGSEFITPLIGQVDCLITGDTKYHDMQNAVENNLAVIDAGHFLENIMVEKTIDILKNINIEVVKSNQKDYYRYI